MRGQIDGVGVLPFVFYMFSVFSTHIFVILSASVLGASFPSTFPWPFPEQKDKANSRAPSPREDKAPVLS